MNVEEVLIHQEQYAMFRNFPRISYTKMEINAIRREEIHLQSKNSSLYKISPNYSDAKEFDD